MTTATSKVPTVVQALSAVMEDVQAVRKGDRNQSQGFNFRGIDAVVNAVGPALRRHGVVIVPAVEEAKYQEVEVGQKRTLQRECTLRVRFIVHGPAGDTIEGVVCAEALDSGDKATAKAHSVAYRTFLLQALTIPTDETDPDHQTVERSARQAPSLPATISKENVDRMRKACEDAEVDIADVVLAASDSRTDNPAELLTTEVTAARDALKQLSASRVNGDAA